MERAIARFLVKHRHFVVILFIIVSIIFGYGITKLEIKVNLGELLPKLHPYVKTHLKFQEMFGGADAFVVEVRVKEGDIFNYKTLKKIKDVTDDIQFYKDVRRALVTSISQRKSKAVKGVGGGTVEAPALMYPVVPKDPGKIQWIKKSVYTNELYNGVLVSKDGKASLIIADLKEDVDYQKFFEFMKNLTKKYEDNNTTLHVAGRPILMGWIFHYLPEVNKIFAITIIFIIIIIVLIFRSFLGVLIPLIAGGLSAIWGLGLLALLGLTVDPLMLVIPFLIGARALSHSIQVTSRYLEEFSATNWDIENSVQNLLEGMFMASLAAIVTDAAGFLVLVLAKIVAIQKLSLLCTFWVIAIFLLVELFGPLLSFYLPLPKRIKLGGAEVSQKYLGKLGEWLGGSGRVWAIAITAILFVGGIYYSITHLKVGDLHPGSPILWPESRYNKDVDEINKRFDQAGTDTYNVIIEGKENAMETPTVLRRIEAFERYIRKSFPSEVGGTQSLVLIAKKLNLEYHEGDPKWDIIPEKPEAIGFYFFSYRGVGDPEDFNIFTDPLYKYGNIRIFFKNHMGDTIKRAFKVSNNFLTLQKPLKEAKFKLAGGLIGVFGAINEEIETSQKWTILIIAVVVFLFCSISFKSILAGIILSIPLITSTGLAFAYMAYANIGLDVNTLPISAIGFGLGVDYGIYLLSRIQEEYGRIGKLDESIKIGMGTCGLAIIYTAIPIIFSVLIWYFLSDLRFQADMGLLLALIMGFNCLGAIFFIPSIVSVLKPRFILNKYRG